MRTADFHKFQQCGENVCVEFKRGGNGAQKDAFETICAFLNRFGGDVFLGVADDGEIVGVPHGEVEPIMRHIVNVASDPQQMDPPFYFSALQQRCFSGINGVTDFLHDINCQLPYEFVK